MSGTVARIEGKNSAGLKVAFFTQEHRLGNVLLKLQRDGGMHSESEDGEWRFVECKEIRRVDFFDHNGMMLTPLRAEFI